MAVAIFYRLLIYVVIDGPVAAVDAGRSPNSTPGAGGRRYTVRMFRP